MSAFLRGPILAALICAGAGAAAAPRAEPGARPDPTDPRAQVPPLQQRSALATYRRLADDPPRDWREANDAVARIGGWRTYLRESQAPAPAPAASGARR
jgi:hypothetical protein